MFKVRLASGRTVRAGVATEARHAMVRIIAGAQVELRLSSHDPNRGQIIRQL